MAQWLFSFDMLNFFAPLFYAAFKTGSFATLYTLLIVEMGFKALLELAQSYAWIVYYMIKKRNAMSKCQDVMELDEINDLRSIIHRQKTWVEMQTSVNDEMMEAEEDEIAEGYMDIIKQFGYICMFS